MKGIFFKITFLFLIAIIIVQSLVWVYWDKLMEDEYHVFKHKEQILNGEKKPGKMENLIIGDCLGMTSLNPKEMAGLGSTYNLSLAGTTPLEAYYMLKRYLKYNPPPEKVLLTWGTFNFMELDNFILNTLGFGLLTLDEFHELKDIISRHHSSYHGSKFLLSFNYKPVSSLGLLLPDHLSLQIDYFAGKLKINPFYFKRLKTCLFKGCYTLSPEKVGSLIEKNLGYYEIKDIQGGPEDIYQLKVDWNNFIPSPLLDHYLDKIIELAAEKNIKITYLHPPITNRNFTHIDKQFIVDFKNYLKSKESEQFKVLFNSIFITYPDSYFTNNILLNNKGAVKFSEFLNNEYN